MGFLQTGRILAPEHGVLAALLIGLTAGAVAGTVTIDDRAGVLANGRAELTEAAAKAPFDVRIFSRDNTSSKNDLNAMVDNSIRTGPDNVVAVGVDTRLRYLHIAANNAQVDGGDVDSAQRAAGNQFKTGDWTGGMVAAINQLSDAAHARAIPPVATTGKARADASSPFPSARQEASVRKEAPTKAKGGIPWGMILLLVGGFFVLRMFMGRARKRREAANYGHRDDYSETDQPPPHPGGNYPGGGLGGYNREAGGSRGGGLLGGLGGGILGYLLGRRSGRSNQDNVPPDRGGFGSSGSGNAGGGHNSGDRGGFISGSSNSGDFGGDDNGGNRGGFVSGSSNSGDFGGSDNSGSDKGSRDSGNF